MNMGEFFDSLSNYSFEDMQRKARMKEAEKDAAKSNGDEVVEEKKADVDGDGKTDVKVTTVESSSDKSPEEIAKHVSEKIRATSEFMEPEEFNKLLMGKASSDSAEDDEEETSGDDSSKSQSSKEWAEDLLNDCKKELSRIESSGEEGKAAAEKLGVVDFYKGKIAALEKELADGSYGEKSSANTADLPDVVLSDESVKKEC